MFQLLCTTTSGDDTQVTSTKAMPVAGGCLVRVTTRLKNLDGGNYAIAEALAFVPGVKIVDDVDGDRKLVSASCYPQKLLSLIRR